MRVDRWFPFFDIGKTLGEMDRMFGRMGRPLGLRSVPRGTFPAVNIYEQKDAIVLTAEVPGVAPKALDLTVPDDSVMLKGERKPEELSDGSRIYRKERAAGSFVRTMTLPEIINTDSACAEYRNGVLRVRMEKADKARAKRIKIES